MQPPSARLVHVVVSLVLTGVACQHVGHEGGSSDGDTPRACTEMACTDAATITTKLSAAGAPLGTHTFALEIDGKAQTCTVEFASETQTADNCLPDSSSNLNGSFECIICWRVAYFEK